MLLTYRSLLLRGGQRSPAVAFTVPELDPDDIEDLDDAPEQEVKDAEAHILDQATTARSIAELKAEIETRRETGAPVLRRHQGHGQGKARPCCP